MACAEDGSQRQDLACTHPSSIDVNTAIITADMFVIIITVVILMITIVTSFPS